jgi:enoyl-CoA hydratase/carnithine racemase
MPGIEITPAGRWDWLKISMGRANVVGPGFLKEMETALEEIATPGDEAPARPVIVTGDGSSFCAGLDLITLLEYDRPSLEEFFANFRGTFLALACLPRPTIAAVNGHAIGAGCLLLLACDRRLAANTPSHCIGLKVSTFGLPLPPFGATLVRNSLPQPSHELQLTSAEELFTPKGALRLGILDRVVPAREFESAVRKEAQRLTRSTGRAAARRKAKVKDVIFREQESDPDHTLFLDVWFSKETQRRLRQAASGLIRRRSDSGDPPS